MSQSLNTLCIGKVLTHVDECCSTNDFIKELLAKNKPIEGSTVLTDIQTQGRGQYGNQWESEAGKNLTFSVLLYPTFLNANEQFVLSKLACISIALTIEKICPGKVEVKWPNDVYYDGKKISGVLIENQIQGSNLSNAIIGIGLNVNQTAFSKSLNATSISEALGKTVTLDSVLSPLLKQMDVFYIQLRKGNPEVLNELYLKYLLGYGTQRSFIKKGRKFVAKVMGVSDNGSLLLEENGETLHYGFKEIEWVFD